MKKQTILIALVGAMMAGLVACTPQQEKQQTPATNEFNYMVENFADLGILRYRVPDFENLTTQQKALVYYLNEAALWGRDILCDQNCRYNLRIRRACETIYINYTGDKTTEEWKAFELYLKRIWFANGIHHHYSEDKILPTCSRAWFEEACAHCGVQLDDEVMVVIFDPTVMAKKVNSVTGQDLCLTSACNYYENVTQAEAEAWYAAHKDNSPEPKWIGLNSKLTKNEQGEVIERVFKATEDGLYREALVHVVENLEKALVYAENDKQREVISKLIEFNKTGDLTTFNQYAIAWVQDLDSRVDFVNGFTEVYGDPLGVTGAWESLVNFKDEAATRRAQTLSDNAQWFEDNSPIAPQYKKAECKGVSAKVITAAILAGDCYPATPIGINLPNANWIRKNYGSKSVTIANLTEAYNQASLGNGFNEEFILEEADREIARQYGAYMSDIHVDLHECLGHGSGQMLPGVDKNALKEHGSTIEECRADLFSIYYMADPKLVELGIVPDAEAYKAQYYHQLLNGALTQLVRIEPGKQIEEAHMRNRAINARWVLAHCNPAQPEVEIIEQDGKHYLRINDYEGVRALFGQLLAITQEIVSTGNYEAACQLVEEYGVAVDSTLHQELLARYQPLNIPPYKGFVNPIYTAHFDAEGEITDVTLDYTEGYTEQHLRYSRDYSPLPDVNK